MPRSEFDAEAIPVEPGKLLTLQDGGVVYIKGDVGDQAYLVRDGSVEIREGGRVLETIEPGELFGEMAVVDSEPRTASAVAIGPTELVRIDPQEFRSLVRDVGGYAIHGTNETSRIGRRASHGCVRLNTVNAATLYSLVQANGYGRTSIVISRW